MRRLLALAALGLVAALASGCATGFVGKPTKITGTSATINGIVWTTDGGDVTYWVEYGTTTAYDQQSAARTVGVAEDAPHGVSVPLAGLTPSTTWHYRICAEDAQAGRCSKDAALFTGDSVTGSGVAGANVIFDVDAHSGPSGETARGTFAVKQPGTARLEFPVSCLHVSGNTAVVGAGFAAGGGAVGLVQVVDGAPDTIATNAFDFGFCDAPWDPRHEPAPLVSGDFVVVDAAP
jgi:hypothetical protein